MIGLDTNILIAWFVEGRSKGLPRSQTFRVSHVALMEFTWALANRFDYPKEAVLRALAGLMDASDVILDRPDVVSAAIEDYASGGADFNDFMIAHDNLAAGCSTTLTLDAAASRKAGFTYLRS